MNALREGRGEARRIPVTSHPAGSHESPWTQLLCASVIRTRSSAWHLFPPVAPLGCLVRLLKNPLKRCSLGHRGPLLPHWASLATGREHRRKTPPWLSFHCAMQGLTYFSLLPDVWALRKEGASRKPMSIPFLDSQPKDGPGSTFAFCPKNWMFNAEIARFLVSEPRVRIPDLHLPAVWPQASNPVSLNVSFLICK